MSEGLPSHDNLARNFAIEILRKEPTRSLERIREVASKALEAARNFVPDLPTDVETLTAELRHIFSVDMERATILDDHDPSAHLEWLRERRGKIQWRFWRRYMEYLERDFGMPPPVINKLDELTDDILRRLEDPTRDGPWDRRGMVVGSVQSGKTANYTGLICKAIDSGYKLVIVLAGVHSNLRAQTQLRIDEGVLGFDTQKSRRLDTNSRWIGVGTHGERLVVHSLTSSAEDGDFNKKVADNIGVMLGGDPVVLIVKKNSRLLGNLIKWVKHVAGRDDPRTGRRVIPSIPLLLIDDEADNASINTRYRKAGDSDQDTASAINGKIREILSTFERSAYVGYTATPFANIFINPSAQSDAHGEDIFPRSFIINVKAPSDYVGPTLVFGLTGDPDAGIDGSPALPISKIVKDHDRDDSFPPRHGKDHVPTTLPDSLRRAIRCFILACAARRARGQKRVHNSMLVHVTRFVDVQARVADLLRDELLPIQRRLEFGDGNRSPSLLDEFRESWESEFLPVSEILQRRGLAGPAVTWAEIEAELHPATAKMVVSQINGFAREALEYKDHQADGLSVIAVGGDKLSRGLTLEGLTVSYFLRTSRMYDTLMQMGRWFGYRPGYLDLCRLFTTAQLLEWYRHIALAEVELRREFDYMVAADRSPRDYGLRVRTHPDGMIVTAINKMCHSQTLELSWSGVLVQTTQLPMDPSRIAANLRSLEAMISRLGQPRRESAQGSLVWTNVPADRVCSFIESLQMPPESARASGRELAAFIRRQASSPQPELTSWTVVLVSNERSAKPGEIAGHKVGLIERTPESQKPGDSFGLRKANILSPKDEAADLRSITATRELLASLVGAQPEDADDDEVSVAGAIPRTLADVALEITRRRIAAGTLRGSERTSVANGRVIRELRPKTMGLLLVYPLIPPSTVKDGETSTPTGLSEDGPPIVGVALSFPASDTASRVEYRVNRVWSSELEEDALYED